MTPPQGLPLLPGALTPSLVHDLLKSIRRDPSKFDGALAAHCTLWMRWHTNGQDRSDYNAGRAARAISEALNTLRREHP